MQPTAYEKINQSKTFISVKKHAGLTAILSTERPLTSNPTGLTPWISISISWLALSSSVASCEICLPQLHEHRMRVDYIQHPKPKSEKYKLPVYYNQILQESFVVFSGRRVATADQWSTQWLDGSFYHASPFCTTPTHYWAWDRHWNGFDSSMVGFRVKSPKYRSAVDFLFQLVKYEMFLTSGHNQLFRIW